MRASAPRAGWQYNHWRGEFYPRDLAKAQWFDYYAARFHTVEVSNTFYRQPADRTWDRWRAMATDGFCFALKANRFLTHVRRLDDPAPTIERFFDGALRLGDRLGPVLYQLPPFFTRTPEHAERFEAFLARLPGGRTTPWRSATRRGTSRRPSRRFGGSALASVSTT